MSARHRHHGTSKKKTARKVVSYIFSFFLSVDLLVLTLFVSLYFGVLSDRGFISVLDSYYYEYVLNYVEDEAKYYTLPTGIDPAVLNDVFTTEKIQVHVNRYITKAFNEGVYEPDFTEEREKLTQNVTTAFSNDGVIVAEGTEAQEITKTYVDEIMEIYKTALRMPGIDAIAKVKDTIVTVFPIAVIVLAVIAIALIVLILRLHHYLHRALRFVAYATGGAALMSFAVPFYLLQSRAYEGLNVEPQYFYYFCMSFIRHLISLSMKCSLVFLAVTVVVAVICGALRSQLEQRHLRHHS